MQALAVIVALPLPPSVTELSALHKLLVQLDIWQSMKLHLNLGRLFKMRRGS